MIANKIMKKYSKYLEKQYNKYRKEFDNEQ